VEAAKDVSFDVADGEIFGLLGPNGAGKTTTVECVVGLRDPDDGTIEVCGIDARRDRAAVKRKIGTALQNTSLQDKITPREALGLFGTFYPRPVPAEQLLSRFALDDKADAAFDTLSGGQRQRLALALAFVNQPELVFLDEPTAGLDPQSRRELHGEIARMKADGHTVLLTTHYIEEAEQLCDRIAIIDRGHIIATGTPRELIDRSTAVQTIACTTAQPLDAAALGRLPSAEGVAVSGRTVTMRTTDARRTLAALLGLLESASVDVVDLHLQKARLEDVFLELTAAGDSE
jgi:ABC-2 type transport system ATP-binding protein